MNPQYLITDTSNIFTPALVFYKEIIAGNIAHCLKMAKSAGRLRPHIKTHKTREIVGMKMAAGIRKFKCATMAEAEMLAECDAKDVLLAYSIVGPNARRVANLVKSYPQSSFSVLVDHPVAASALSQTMTEAGQTVGVYLDIDVGQHRTGIAAGPSAAALYEQVVRLPGLTACGLHVYDGHNHQGQLSERKAAVEQQIQPVLQMRTELEGNGLAVPTIVAGGTPTFPVYAEMDIPGLECAPGTCILHDRGYGNYFGDMGGFVPAALLLTRVISIPTDTRITLDLGYKAIASDPPAEKRCEILNIPDAKLVLQNEEHLVVETSAANQFSPGSEVYAVPWHICPSCALHQQAYVIEGGKMVDSWKIASRDRMITV